MPGLFRSYQEHGVPVWPWNVPDVRGSNRGMPDLSQNGGETNFTVLKLRQWLEQVASIRPPAESTWQKHSTKIKITSLCLRVSYNKFLNVSILNQKFFFQLIMVNR